MAETQEMSFAQLRTEKMKKLQEKSLEELGIMLVKHLADGGEFAYREDFFATVYAYAMKKLGIESEKYAFHTYWGTKKDASKKIEDQKAEVERLKELRKRYPDDKIEKVLRILKDPSLADRLSADQLVDLVKDIENVLELLRGAANLKLDVSWTSLDWSTHSNFLEADAFISDELVIYEGKDGHLLENGESLMGDDKILSIDPSKKSIYIVDENIKGKSHEMQATCILHECRHAWQYEHGRKYGKSLEEQQQNSSGVVDHYVEYFGDENEADAEKFAYETMLDLKKIAKEHLSKEDYEKFCKNMDAYEAAEKPRVYAHERTCANPESTRRTLKRLQKVSALLLKHPKLAEKLAKTKRVGGFIGELSDGKEGVEFDAEMLKSVNELLDVVEDPTLLSLPEPPSNDELDAFGKYLQARKLAAMKAK